MPHHVAACGECGPCHQAKPCYCVHHGSLNFGGCRQDGTTSISGVDSDEAFTSNFFQQSSFATHAITPRQNVVKVWHPFVLISSHTTAPAQNTHAHYQTLYIPTYSCFCPKISKDLPLAKFAPLGCAVQTGAGSIINSFGARPGTPPGVP